MLNIKKYWQILDIKKKTGQRGLKTNQQFENREASVIEDKKKGWEKSPISIASRSQIIRCSPFVYFVHLKRVKAQSTESKIQGYSNPNLEV